MKIIVIWLLLGSGVFGRENKCHFMSTPTIETNANADKIFTYVESDNSLLYKKAVPDGILLEYQGMISNETVTDQSYLLQRQINLLDKNDPESQTLRQLFDDVGAQRIGHIRPINCLESLLFKLHLSLQGVGSASEFSAGIFKQTIKGKPYLKIIFASNDKINAPDLTELLIKENKPIWTFFHNHFFVFDLPTGDIGGTLVPSGDDSPGTFLHPLADLAVFRKLGQKLGLKEAWITNGFDSSHFAIEDKSQDGNFWIY